MIHKKKCKDIFARLAGKTAHGAGHPLTFILAVMFIVMWAMTGPIFNYSDTWQLIVNTSTTIITFLMVFLIQATQNRDTRALQIKLDELIRATDGAHLALLDLEELSDDDLCRFQNKYEAMAREARKKLKKKSDI